MRIRDKVHPHTAGVRLIVTLVLSHRRSLAAMGIRFSALLATTLALVFVLWVRKGASQALDVPVRLQAELLAKVATYDRSFAARARGRALVLVAVKKGDAESERVGRQLLAELAVLPQLGGLPHAEELVHFDAASTLLDVIRAREPAVVYFSARLGGQIGSVADGLDGVPVLTVGVSASYVAERAVLGFDSSSGKPKLVVHLTQARRQKVSFKPELLALARVIE